MGLQRSRYAPGILYLFRKIITDDIYSKRMCEFGSHKIHFKIFLLVKISIFNFSLRPKIKRLSDVCLISILFGTCQQVFILNLGFLASSTYYFDNNLKKYHEFFFIFGLDSMDSWSISQNYSINSSFIYGTIYYHFQD